MNCHPNRFKHANGARWVGLIHSTSPFDGIYGMVHFEITLLTLSMPDLLPVWGNLDKWQKVYKFPLNEASSRLFYQMLATLQIKPQDL